MKEWELEPLKFRLPLPPPLPLPALSARFALDQPETEPLSILILTGITPKQRSA